MVSTTSDGAHLLVRVLPVTRRRAARAHLLALGAGVRAHGRLAAQRAAEAQQQRPLGAAQVAHLPEGVRRREKA